MMRSALRMLIGAMAAVLAVIVAMLAPLPALSAEDTPPAVSIPTGKGLPVQVRAALLFNSFESFDDNKGRFVATTDLRLTWFDPRLRFPANESLHGYKEYRVSAAEEQIAKIWTPRIRYLNRVGEPSFTERRLRIFPDGKVETIARTTAEYKASVDVARFPFDRQSLAVEVATHEDTVESVDLDFSNADVEFSRVAKSAELEGWTLGLVNLRREALSGWNGDRYAKIVMAVAVERLSGSTIATIFIPLFASLLIPFLATWMNKAEGGEFEIDAFELANIVIGGLFAVIALGFTISSSYPAIVSSDNTVTRLIGLNYVALAVGLLITVMFYRYRLPARWFGPYVQEQAYRFLSWAFPLSFIVTGLAIVMASAA